MGNTYVVLGEECYLNIERKFSTTKYDVYNVSYDEMEAMCKKRYADIILDNISKTCHKISATDVLVGYNIKIITLQGKYSALEATDIVLSQYEVSKKNTEKNKLKSKKYLEK